MSNELGVILVYMFEPFLTQPGNPDTAAAHIRVDIYRLKFFLFFLLANASVSLGAACPLPPACRPTPTPNPAEIDLHVARSPDKTKDMTRLESSADKGPN